VLYLIRHGTSDQPILRTPGDLTPASREEWALDHGLSEQGRAEAAALGTWLAKVAAPDLVLTSPRRRTQETARLACPEHPFVVDERLHEWHDDETPEALEQRARSVLASAESSVVFAFTHGGFIRAVVAAILVGGDAPRFGPTFHDLRRTLHVWNASVTLVAHGASGLELFAVNLCPSIDRLLGRG
jgi:broad specificity phosphatase PhoE